MCVREGGGPSLEPSPLACTLRRVATDCGFLRRRAPSPLHDRAFVLAAIVQSSYCFVWDIHMDRAPPRPGRGSHRVPRARVVRASAPTRWRALPLTLARGALARGLSWLAGGLLRRRRLTLTMTRIWAGASPLQS